MSYLMIFHPIWLTEACPTYGLQEPTATQPNPALYFHCTHITADPVLNLGFG